MKENLENRFPKAPYNCRASLSVFHIELAVRKQRNMVVAIDSLLPPSKSYWKIKTTYKYIISPRMIQQLCKLVNNNLDSSFQLICLIRTCRALKDKGRQCRE